MEEDPGNGRPEADDEAGSQYDSDEAEEDEEEDNMPSFEFRFETAKLLIELDNETDAAIQASHRLCKSAFPQVKAILPLTQLHTRSLADHC